MLPTANAVLNGTATALLILGFACIRRGKRIAHRNCMFAALIVSALFMLSYLIYHFNRTYITGVGPTPFAGKGASRPVYFAILISHTVLAVVVVPLVLRTLYLARRERFEHHRRLARWTLPIWLYVSVTGVVIYLMLYHLYAPTGGEGGTAAPEARTPAA